MVPGSKHWGHLGLHPTVPDLEVAVRATADAHVVPEGHVVPVAHDVHEVQAGRVGSTDLDAVLVASGRGALDLVAFAAFPHPLKHKDLTILPVIQDTKITIAPSVDKG